MNQKFEYFERCEKGMELKMINLELYKIFATVAKEGNITKVRCFYR